MNTQLNELVAAASKYLENKLRLKPPTVARYGFDWRQIKIFMTENKIKVYNRNVEARIFKSKFKEINRNLFSRAEKRFYYSVKALTQFKETGEIKATHRPEREPFIFTGKIGSVIVQFLEEKTASNYISKSTYYFYEKQLILLFKYCQARKIQRFDQIDLAFIFHYLRQAEYNGRYAIRMLLNFTKYLFEKNITPFDYSGRIPKFRATSQPKLPSKYSKEEISRLISSIDRSSPTGKRDYCIVLLASSMGLRASDIADLKFENIDWDRGTLEKTQVKTGNTLFLPLLPEVGNAIINYCQYSRPKSDEPYIFLTVKPPFKSFSDGSSLSTVVMNAFKRAGINTDSRKHGAHALRHSLVDRMLKKKTRVNVISETLGQANGESVRYYLRIDLEAMFACVLDVPKVDPKFYDQKGGIFYA